MKNMLRVVYLALGITLFIAAPSRAQEVDFDMPAEINIIQGRLSVAFHEGVGAMDAEVLMKSLGYPVLQSHFYDWTARAHGNKLLNEDQVRDIKANPGVLNVSQSSLGSVHTTTSPNDPAFPGYLVMVTFASHITRKAALDILKPFDGFSFQPLATPPNEMIIEVGDQDEVAMPVLQNQEQVKWVTYVGIGSDG